MSNLKTNYLGIELKNPIIVGACGLTSDVQHLKKMEEAGAAAIVYKSLFEEQIQLENLELEQSLNAYDERHAEMLRLFPGLDHAGPEEFLHDLSKAVKSVSIPVFASLNAVYDETWPEWATRLEKTGVAGIELNFYQAVTSFEDTAKEIVDKRVEIISEVKKQLKIPVVAKLSPYYTNPLHVVKKMDNANADGFVLFNRLFQPDIDIEKVAHVYPYNFSNPDDHRLSLRYIGLLHGNIKGDLCAANGISDHADVIRMILAGANTTQIVSTLYKNGISYISDILTGIEDWMVRHNYKSIDEFRGKLSHKMLKDPFAYKRAQYVDILMKSDKILKDFPVL